MKENKFPRIIYAGDREISVKILKFIVEQGCLPIALMVSDTKRASHSEELTNLCKADSKIQIFKGDQFRAEKGVELIRNLKPDYIISVHFPYIVPNEILNVPMHGVLNLHPAYLPYNRGWHTPTWAIWDETPYGATLHFMDEGIDTGDIICQKQVEVCPDDTADSLYKKVLNLEFEMFREVWPSLIVGKYSRKPQVIDSGSVHKKSEINSIQYIDSNQKVKAGDLIRRFRALTTSNIKEAAYFKEKNKIYRIQVKIVKDEVES